jgi:hypothetical protein
MKLVFEEEKTALKKIMMCGFLNINIILLEPFTMTCIDLDFFIEDIVKDSEINCFLFGFVYEK